MKIKTCYLFLCVAWVSGFICLIYHTFAKDDLDLLSTLGVYALFLISASMGCPCCNSSCCKKED